MAAKVFILWGLKHDFLVVDIIMGHKKVFILTLRRGDDRGLCIDKSGGRRQ